jgi:uncharacterized membrane protein YgcG
MANLAGNVGVEAAPPDDEQAEVPVLYQVGEMVGVDFLLHAIGFITNLQRANLMEVGLVDYDDFQFLNEKDIRDMAEEFAKRTVANGRMTFGVGRLKKLIGVMHWIQDHYRVGAVPDHNEFSEEELAQALVRAQIRKSDLDLVDTNTKAADPGKFKDERKWPEWQKSFVNYLSVIPGVFGVPLAYVVREQEEPNPEAEYLNFTEKMIASAPLFGQFYEADSRRVHNLLTSFLQGENTETWIRTLARYNDGRRDITALRRHYAGEGNSTRRITDAKRIQNTLHYKSERALPFGLFLGKLQQMFTIFEEAGEGEELTERAKIDELLTKTQHPSLTAALAQLRFMANTNTDLTFTVAANHLSQAISQTPDYQMARSVRSTNTSYRDGGSGRNSGRGGGGRFGNRGRGDSGRGRGRGFHGGRGYTTPQRNSGRGITSGYYSPADWSKLSFEERDQIRKDRDKRGEQGGTKRSVAQVSFATDDTSELTPNTQAGNAFGGKQSAAKKAKGSSE